jgi:hypothetical protein
MLRKKRGHLYNCLEILVKLVVNLKLLVTAVCVFLFALDAAVFFVISLKLLSQSKHVDSKLSLLLSTGFRGTGVICLSRYEYSLTDN